jgi:predicted nuclease of restriction endonuclease-like RecB superfamily
MKQNKLPVIIKNDQIIPLLFTEQDVPWLTKLMIEVERFCGKTILQWIEYKTLGFTFDMPYLKGNFAISEIEKLCASKSTTNLNSKKLRENIFQFCHNIRLNQGTEEKIEIIKFRNSVLEQASTKLQFTPTYIDSALFADYPNFSVFSSLAKHGSVYDLISLLNSKLVRTILLRSSIIEIITTDHCRRLVRQAKLRGLVCEILTKNQKQNFLRISGPLSLFRSTNLYGRRLFEFIPLLFWNYKFNLRASCNWQDGNRLYLNIDSNMPLKPANPPLDFDSKLESQFYFNFLALTTEWHLLREPEAFEAENRLFFPDFDGRHLQSGFSVLLEVIGYWGDQYIQKKIEEAELLKDRHFVFCVADKYKSNFKCPSPKHRIVPFKRKINPKEVLAALIELKNLQV